MSRVSPGRRRASRPGELLNWLCRLGLGLVFIYAASGKIADPGAFALLVEGYRILPAWAPAPVAIVLPWVEFWAGLAVLTGFWGRAAAWLLALLLLVFLAAVSYNLARGLAFDCGCFGGRGQAGPDLLGQDALLLLAALRLIFSAPAPEY